MRETGGEILCMVPELRTHNTNGRSTASMCTPAIWAQGSDSQSRDREFKRCEQHLSLRATLPGHGEPAKELLPDQC